MQVLSRKFPKEFFSVRAKVLKITKGYGKILLSKKAKRRTVTS